jgi:hypothetical protein
VSRTTWDAEAGARSFTVRSADLAGRMAETAYRLQCINRAAAQFGADHHEEWCAHLFESVMVNRWRQGSSLQAAQQPRPWWRRVWGGLW